MSLSLFLSPQLEGEIEVLHTARARYDWYGEDKLDLRVRQGDNVDILRLNNNPGGKWLARSQDGNCEFKLKFYIFLK